MHTDVYSTDSCYASPSVPRAVCDLVNRRRRRLQTHIVVPRYESAPTSIVADGQILKWPRLWPAAATTNCSARDYLFV